VPHRRGILSGAEASAAIADAPVHTDCKPLGTLSLKLPRWIHQLHGPHCVRAPAVCSLCCRAVATGTAALYTELR